MSDIPDYIYELLGNETDLATRRNAFAFLMDCKQSLAIEFLENNCDEVVPRLCSHNLDQPFRRLFPAGGVGVNPQSLHGRIFAERPIHQASPEYAELRLSLGGLRVGHDAGDALQRSFGRESRREHAAVASVVADGQQREDRDSGASLCDHSTQLPPAGGLCDGAAGSASHALYEDPELAAGAGIAAGERSKHRRSDELLEERSGAHGERYRRAGSRISRAADPQHSLLSCAIPGCGRHGDSAASRLSEQR